LPPEGSSSGQASSAHLRLDAQLETGFAAEQKEIGDLIGSPNQAEAVAAFFAKRPPRFSDPAV
jgi:hypothetical protein